MALNARVIPSVVYTDAKSGEGVPYPDRSQGSRHPIKSSVMKALVCACLMATPNEDRAAPLAGATASSRGGGMVGAYAGDMIDEIAMAISPKTCIFMLNDLPIFRSYSARHPFLWITWMLIA